MAYTKTDRTLAFRQSQGSVVTTASSLGTVAKPSRCSTRRLRRRRRSSFVSSAPRASKLTCIRSSAARRSKSVVIKRRTRRLCTKPDGA
jgi:hypothetical protein